MDDQEFDILETLLRVRNGDESAIADLFEGIRGYIHFWARRYGAQVTDAEDLVGIVFIKILASRSTFADNNPGKVWRWIRVTTFRSRMELLRASKKSRQLPMDEEGNLLEAIASVGASPMEEEENIAEKEIRKKKLHACISELTNLQQQLLHLRYSKDVEWKEIAEATERTEASCKYHYQTAKKQLRICLDS